MSGSQSVVCRLYYAALQNQKAVSAHFTSKQILPFGFAVDILGVSEFLTASSVIVLFVNARVPQEYTIWETK